MASRIARVMTNARYRAKSRNLAFTIQSEDLTWPETCPILGTRLRYDESPESIDSAGSTWDIPSIDRLDSTIGYVPLNCRVISWRANRLKSNATLDELKRLVDWIAREKADAAPA